MSTCGHLRINLFKGSTNSQPVKVLSLAEALNAIQDGTYRQNIQQLRDMLHTRGKRAYNAEKKQLDGVTFCGTFSPTRAKAHLVEHNGIVHGDLDHLDNLPAIKQGLCADPYTLYCFDSPSGTGLKVGVRVEPVKNAAAYKHAWQAVAAYHQQRYGIIWDKSGKDISRLCYVSWDPDLYGNPLAPLFPVPPMPALPKPTLITSADPMTADRRQQYGQQAIDTAIKIIDASMPGNRHHARLRASRLLGGYIAGGMLSYDEAYTALEGAVERNTDDVSRSMKTIADGLRHGQELPITLEELEAERQEWLNAHGRASRDRHPRPVSSQQRQGQSGQTPAGPVDPQGTAAASDEGTLPSHDTAAATAESLLQTLRETPEDQRSPKDIFHAIDLLAELPTSQWAIFKTEAKALLGKSLNLNDLEKARNERARDAARHSPGSSSGSAAGTSGSTLAADLAAAYDNRLAHDLTQQCWRLYSAKQDGIWSEIEREVVLGELRDALTVRLPDGFSAQLLRDVEFLLQTHLYRTFTPLTPGWLPCLNGALHLETLSLHPHSPDRLFSWCVPYQYDPTAICPNTQAWMHETVENAHDQVQVLRAYAKAVVTQRVDLQRYLETIGPGGTGKGTYTRLLQALVGVENTFATELKHLETNRFELSNLQGKVLMVVTDADRYGGSVNALKAVTGQDFVRMEEKFKAQRTAIAPVMVVVSANEPIPSADSTSGLVRRRLSMMFRHRPAAPRDLLSWHEGAWQGELAPEIPGVLNWVLALPDAQMEALLQKTTETVPTLQKTWAQSLVDTNPLAEWANQVLVSDDRKDAQGNPLAVVNVGRAHKRAHENEYEYQDMWLYPNYRAWVDDTGGSLCRHGASPVCSKTSLRISSISLVCSTRTITRARASGVYASEPPAMRTNRCLSRPPPHQ